MLNLTTTDRSLTLSLGDIPGISPQSIKRLCDFDRDPMGWDSTEVAYERFRIEHPGGALTAYFGAHPDRALMTGHPLERMNISGHTGYQRTRTLYSGVQREIFLLPSAWLRIHYSVTTRETAALFDAALDQLTLRDRFDRATRTLATSGSTRGMFRKQPKTEERLARDLLAEPYTSQVTRRLCAHPRLFDLGEVPVGRTASAGFTLYGQGDVHAKIPAGFQIYDRFGSRFKGEGQSWPLSLSGNEAMTISFRPTAPGEVKGQVRLSSGGSTAEVLEVWGQGITLPDSELERWDDDVTLELSTAALPPELPAPTPEEPIQLRMIESCNAIDFGAVAFDVPVTRVLQVRNHYDTPCRVFLGGAIDLRESWPGHAFTLDLAACGLDDRVTPSGGFDMAPREVVALPITCRVRGDRILPPIPCLLLATPGGTDFLSLKFKWRDDEDYALWARGWGFGDYETPSPLSMAELFDPELHQLIKRRQPPLPVPGYGIPI